MTTPPNQPAQERRGRRSGAARLLGTAAAAASLLGAGALALGPGQGRAQEAGSESGLRLSLDVGSEIRAGRGVTVDGEEGDILSDTDLTLGIRSETPVQSLRLSFGSTYRALLDEGASELIGPDATLRYDREAAGGGLSVTGSVSTTDLDFVRSILLDEGEDELDAFDTDGDGVIDSEEFETGTGTRRTTRLGFSLDLLRDRPIGLELDGNLRRIDYDEAADSFDESRREALNAALRFRLASNLTARLTYGIERLEIDRDAADDPDEDVRRDTDSYGVSFDYAVSERLTLGLALARSEEDIEEVDGTRIQESGFTGSASADYELPRGSIGARYSRRLDQGDALDRISLSRRFDLPGEDLLVLQLGYSSRDGESAVTADVDYTRRGARGDLTLSASRTAGSSLDDAFATRTSVSARYDRPLTALTDLRITAEYGLIEEEEDEDSEAGLLRATISRQLTRDWALSGGIEGILDDDETDTAVFARVSRSFDLRP